MTEFYFRPNGHWNKITQEVYFILKKHYGSEWLRIVTQDEEYMTIEDGSFEAWANQPSLEPEFEGLTHLEVIYLHCTAKGVAKLVWQESRKQALEEAAGLRIEVAGYPDDSEWSTGRSIGAEDCAKALRALKDS